jgi:cbb3-type cytochrome oxidase subunit 1
MQGVARLFFSLAILFALAGMALGLHMAMSVDHGQRVTHAHIMLAGWVSLALMGLFYHHFPALNLSSLAKVQFWITALGAILMSVSLFFFYGGNPAVEPGAAIGSVGFLLGMLLFAYNALGTIWRS